MNETQAAEKAGYTRNPANDADRGACNCDYGRRDCSHGSNTDLWAGDDKQSNDEIERDDLIRKLDEINRQVEGFTDRIVKILARKKRIEQDIKRARGTK